MFESTLDELEDILDYESLIDRSLPNGTLSEDKEGNLLVFQDGEWVKV